MESILSALGDLILKALPTFFLVLVLHFYLRSMFFKPLEKVLKARDEATAGAQRRAEESLNKAEKKAAEYEEALRQARAQSYREQEEARRQLRTEQAVRTAEARAAAEDSLRQARAGIAEEAAAARKGLELESESLAAQIADAVLRGRTA
jgi:F-type H+-transporting ATPase subunit b